MRHEDFCQVWYVSWWFISWNKCLCRRRKPVEGARQDSAELDITLKVG